MVVLFVHGMGRSPLSGWPLLFQLRRAGLKTESFGYVAALERFESIVARLRGRIERLAKLDSYMVIGHSLGGVLLRAALNSLPEDIAQPRHVYLLGSPILPSRLAVKFRENIVFRALTGDCGQLLGSVDRMNSIGSVKGTVTGIAGVCGLIGAHSPFGQEANDGVVTVSEVGAEWFSDQVEVPVVHTLLPSSAAVANIIMRGVVVVEVG
jgi:pimeloyl-ACP methyl ester carboxylesterase